MDPFRQLLNLADGKRQYVIDENHVTKEEFEAAAVMADVLWGHEGLAEMLGSTWRMVHDPRFMAVERCGIYERKKMFSKGTTAMGVQVIKSSELFGAHGGSIDDMDIYVEVLGEGRHFLKIVTGKGWDPKALTEDQLWTLMKEECPNYQRKDGTWNRKANTLMDLFKAGLISLVQDYAEVAYCTDWIRLDSEEVVAPGQRLMVTDEDGVEVEDDIPVIAVEVDSLYKALTLRSQVRMTAYKLLKQFPGLKATDLDNLMFTDLESDEICSILFTTPFDKLYTAMPAILNNVKLAQKRSFEERLAEETAQLAAESRDFNEKLKSGEVEHIVTEIAEADENDPAIFMAKLTNNPFYAGLFQGLQTMEAQGSEEAKALCEELVSTHGAGDVWDRVQAMVEGSDSSHIDQLNLRNLAAVHGVAWKEKSAATQMVLGENVHATTTEVEGVFDGLNEQVFSFVYLNPHTDPRGHRTAIVDIEKPGGDLDRRTWSIAPEHYKQIRDAADAQNADIDLSTWRRTTDHTTGKIAFTLDAPARRIPIG